jgi:hypothetical protein
LAAEQVETFLWPTSSKKRDNAGRVELGRGFENLRCCTKLMMKILLKSVHASLYKWRPERSNQFHRSAHITVVVVA